MKIKTVLAAAAMCLLIGASGAHAVKSGEAKGALFAASDGGGRVTLVWYPAFGKWPAGGWRVTDAKGTVVADKVVPLGGDSAGGMTDEDVDGIRKLAGLLETTTDPAELGALYFNLGVSALTDIRKARALGLAWSIDGASAGKRAYKVSAIGRDGKAMYTLTSAEVDPAMATPPAPSPSGLRAEAGEQGALLYWQPSPEDRAMPVMAYVVERDWSGQGGALLTDEPLFMAAGWADDAPAFIDKDAPVEQDVTYRVYGVDVFGRRGEPASVRLFIPDLSALTPPTAVRAESGEEEVTLRWKPNKSPNTAGYVIERSFASGGVYEVLTPKGVPADSDEYTDENLAGGSYYYYRIRSVDPRGKPGEPSNAVMAGPSSSDRPGRPSGLRADAGPTRVRLTWDKPAGKVAGYVVERKGEGAPRWAMLTGAISAEPRYDDQFNLGEYGAYSYRVTAVGFDNSESSPSDEVTVVIEDTTPPPAPHIISADGTGGKVRLAFAPSVPEGKTDRFLVVRGSSSADRGLVIGDPLPGGARGFEDEFAAPGEDYWYAVVALDRAGNRSEMSERTMVLVGTPDIPVPPAPAARYEQEPFRHVVLEFGAAPAGLSVSVQYATAEAGPWTLLAESLTVEGGTVHANLPDAGTIYYRVVYKAANGVQGRPSPAVGITIQ